MPLRPLGYPCSFSLVKGKLTTNFLISILLLMNILNTLFLETLWIHLEIQQDIPNWFNICFISLHNLLFEKVKEIRFPDVPPSLKNKPLINCSLHSRFWEFRIICGTVTISLFLPEGIPKTFVNNNQIALDWNFSNHLNFLFDRLSLILYIFNFNRKTLSNLPFISFKIFLSVISIVIPNLTFLRCPSPIMLPLKKHNSGLFFNGIFTKRFVPRLGLTNRFLCLLFVMISVSFLIIFTNFWKSIYPLNSAFVHLAIPAWN